jgi:hypothetical protein
MCRSEPLRPRADHLSRGCPPGPPYGYDAASGSASQPPSAFGTQPTLGSQSALSSQPTLGSQPCLGPQLLGPPCVGPPLGTGATLPGGRSRVRSVSPMPSMPWGCTADRPDVRSQSPMPWGNGHERPEAHRPDNSCHGPPFRPLASGPLHPGHTSGYGVTFGHGGMSSQHAPACSRPHGYDLKDYLVPHDDVRRPPTNGPAGHSLPQSFARLPTPARGNASSPGCTTDRSMANGFKDSTDFVDAGDESEVEFLTTRSLPPTRQTGSRAHREREEASCMACLWWS